MKRKSNYDEEIVDWCNYCKEEILRKEGFVYKNEKYYHLECYHQIHDIPFDLEDDDTDGDLTGDAT